MHRGGVCKRLTRVDPRDGAHRRAVASSYPGRTNWTSPVHGERDVHVRTVVVASAQGQGGRSRKFAESPS